MDKQAAKFWEGCAQGELRYQRCGACAASQFHGRPFCLRCGSIDVIWQSAQGTGTVYALTLVERAPSADFSALAPYVIALVDLDEGFRVMAQAVRGLAIGDRVKAGFFEHNGRHLPRFEKYG
jgi:uncharacterized OB-fold protein